MAADPQETADAGDEAEDDTVSTSTDIAVQPDKKSSVATGMDFIGHVVNDPAVKSIVTGFVTGQASKTLKGQGIAFSILGFAATKIATRSVPGALVVGAGLLAKALYDQKKAKEAEEDEQEEEGAAIEDKTGSDA